MQNGNLLRTIFFVDDQIEVHILVKAILKKYPDYKVEYYLNPLEALEQVKIKRPDLVISDLNMPNLNGDQLLIEINKLPIAVRPHVIMLTGDKDDKSVKMLTDLGAALVLAKSSGIKSIIDSLAETWQKIN